MSSVPAPRAFSKILTTCLVFAAISLVAGAVHGIWTEQEVRYDAANQAVLSKVDATIASALAHWSYTERSHENMTPDVVIEGNAATVVATTPLHVDRLALFDIDTGPKWRLLARSQGGRYFLLTFKLDMRADPDPAHAGWRRLVVDDLALLTNESAKDWLYRQGFTKEFQNEFHSAPPPKQVEG
ncbi:hypothetical protein [Paraburkholderia youngii]|uniref:hypothetical protein n=1 Tax=Paraburkholderia youngii TaxID=2782701 RepID=UPI003D1DA8B5